MIFFVLDACAAARRYFPDIGTANIDQIDVKTNVLKQKCR